MKVFKFGGASVKDTANIINVKSIIESYPKDLVIVVSAMGKTTNALEAVIQAKRSGKLEMVRDRLQAPGSIIANNPRSIYEFEEM